MSFKPYKLPGYVLNVNKKEILKTLSKLRFSKLNIKL